VQNEQQGDGTHEAEKSAGFHEGEIAAQERASLRDTASRIAHSIHTTVPPVVVDFLRTQRLAFVGTLDGDGRPWATALTGPAGFADAPDEHTLRIAVAPTPGDPIADNLSESAELQESQPSRSAQVGVLIVDFAARRRLRVNGRGALGADGKLRVDVDQVYSNCPKHIQARTIDNEAPARPAGEVRAQRRRGLTEAQRERIRRADTFVIASAHPTAGVDCSHRGGTPGFVYVAGDRLMWPDYKGNAMFNTLGNIMAYPRAGLIFVDFDTGDTLQLTGSATVDWDPAHTTGAPGAQRIVTFEVDEAIEAPGAIPFHYQLIEPSKFNPPPWTEQPGARA
jgi:Predicted flavin-nucleotide-binding protein structurally related to pyridoxine 5''-phosphate oxidase